MQKFEKLTQDEQGKLHGGFTLMSTNDVPPPPKYNNANCSGIAGSNLNCGQCGCNANPKNKTEYF